MATLVRTDLRGAGPIRPRSVFIAMWIAAACDGDSPVALLGGGCALDSDCQVPLVCAFERCHEACEETRDCPEGSRCVVVEKPLKVCQLEDERTCAFNTDCAPGQICGTDLQCHMECMLSEDCPSGDICVGGLCALPGEVLEGPLGAAKPTEPECAYDSDCEQGYECRDGSCLVPCLADVDCPVLHVCDPLGQCVLDEREGACVPGQQQTCTCPTGGIGEQTCGHDFVFGPCIECNGSGAGGVGAGGVGGGGMGGTSTSSTGAMGGGGSGAGGMSSTSSTGGTGALGGTGGVTSSSSSTGGFAAGPGTGGMTMTMTSLAAGADGDAVGFDAAWIQGALLGVESRAGATIPTPDGGRFVALRDPARFETFLARFDVGGDLAWEALAWPSPGAHVESMAFGDGALLVGGWLAEHGARRGFVRQLAADGSNQWAAVLGGAGDAMILGVATGRDVRAVCGAFRGDLELGDALVRSKGGWDAFVALVDDRGQLISLEAFGDGADQIASDVEIASDGAVVLTGAFEGALAIGDEILVSEGGRDVFVGWLTSSGVPAGAVRWGGEGSESATELALDGDHAVVAGVMDAPGGADVFVGWADSRALLRWRDLRGDGVQSVDDLAVRPDGVTAMTISSSTTALFGLGSLPDPAPSESDRVRRGVRLLVTIPR